MISIFILHPKSNFLELTSCTVNLAESYYPPNHKNYNFLNCDWFKKLLFSTNSLGGNMIQQDLQYKKSIQES